jgi:uncharacterized protein YlxW (UPF0749 family)
VSREMMIVLIVAIMAVAAILKERYKARRRGHGLPDARAGADSGESRRLQEEVKALKDRIAVLERITVEKENSLAREIEELRERP